VLQLQLGVEIWITRRLTSEVFSLFIEACSEFIVTVLPEHFPVLIHKSQRQVLLIEFTISLEILLVENI